jgi:hypothetical protein
MRFLLALVLGLGAVGMACSTGGAGTTAGTTTTARGSPSALSTVSDPMAPAPPRRFTPAPPRQSKHESFRGTIAPIPPELAARMRGTTWRRGCPVPIRDLRLLRLSYWGFDGAVHRGPMVVNASVASDVVWVFHRLYLAHFPIKHMALTHRYRPKHDNPNTRKSITASFNCRVVVTPAGPGTTLSMHSYGLAIDVNPLQNPFVAADGHTRNRFARPYVDRTKHLPGMIHDGDVVVRAFQHIGWTWGGTWSGDKDYMHFSSNGR